MTSIRKLLGAKSWRKRRSKIRAGMLTRAIPTTPVLRITLGIAPTTRRLRIWGNSFRPQARYRIEIVDPNSPVMTKNGKTFKKSRLGVLIREATRPDRSRNGDTGALRSVIKAQSFKISRTSRNSPIALKTLKYSRSNSRISWQIFKKVAGSLKFPLWNNRFKKSTCLRL